MSACITAPVRAIRVPSLTLNVPPNPIISITAPVGLTPSNAALSNNASGSAAPPVDSPCAFQPGRPRSWTVSPGPALWIVITGISAAPRMWHRHWYLCCLGLRESQCRKRLGIEQHHLVQRQRVLRSQANTPGTRFVRYVANLWVRRRPR